MNEMQKSLSCADVTSLCDAAAVAWDKVGPRTATVKFAWRCRKFKSTLTMFRMLVKTLDDEPVASRYI